MEYRVLTEENRRDLLKKRIQEYEITHFQAFCEHELAKLQGIADIAAAKQETLEHFEALLAWCHAELDKLGTISEA